MTDRSAGCIIAVVDDDQRLLKSLGDLLESAELEVRLFASAKVLLESGCLAEIDCLISDIGMPVMDGFELLRVARTSRPGLPVILMTGHADLLIRIPPTGADHYRLFRKPFDGEALLAAVIDALRNSPPITLQS